MPISTYQHEDGPHVVDDGTALHSYTDPAALRRFVATHDALVATYPLVAFTLDDDARVLTWSGPDAQPQDVAAVVATHQAALSQREQAINALRARVRALAQSAVGIQIDQLTAPQTRALVAVLLHKQGAIDTTGAIRPLADWE